MGTVSMRSLDSLCILVDGHEPRVVRHAMGWRAGALAHGSGVESGMKPQAGFGRRTECNAARGKQEILLIVRAGRDHGINLEEKIEGIYMYAVQVLGRTGGHPHGR